MMTDQRALTPSGLRNPLRRHLRSSSQSPSRQRLGDDLLSRLSPATAVESLRTPTGALKLCLDQASAAERSFATRTAVASQKIHEWVDELSLWPWPAQGGSAGFEIPPAKRRKLFDTETPTESPKGEPADLNPQPNIRYFGSLSADDVILYEKRTDQIQEEMEELDLEEIKTQVLHNHILPLSRPGTPFSDAGLSVVSTMSFTKMEDLTAVVTALIMQTLPKLSKLSRLLNTWSIRLLLLPKIPALMTMLTDAEVALRSGWNALKSSDDGSKDPTGADGDRGDGEPTVTRKDFEVMKSVLRGKIQKPGQEVDYMLDALEGMQDTLPDEWLERLEAIEEDYAQWEIAAEQQVQENEWFRTHGTAKPSHLPSQPQTPGPKIQIQGPSPAKDPDSYDDSFLSPPSAPVDRSLANEDASSQDAAGRPSTAEQLEEPAEYGAVKILIDEPSNDTGRLGSAVVDLTEHAAHQRDIDSGAVTKNPSLDYDNNNSGRPGTAAVTNEDLSESDSDLPRLSSGRSSTRSYDGTRDARADANTQGKPALSELDRNVVRASPALSSKISSNSLRRLTTYRESESPILESDEEAEDDEEDELNLPPIIQRARRGSQISMASTVLHGSTSHFFDQSDDAPFREGSAELELPRLPDPDEPFSSDALSPPSSPPLRYKPRSTSVTFKDNPDVAPTPSGSSTPPRSPLAPPVVFDPDVSYELESPSRISNTSDDDRRLQRQIGAILESIPLKIRLNSKASAINLNPPDFQPPRPRPRTSDARDARRPSVSSLSSRAGTPSTFSRSGTPSYMLAPARHTGPRSKSSQEIKVYHLMRAGSDAPIKLFIRTVGERNERVMVRVGGGWSDLGEYLREYALHHGRRSRGEGKVEVTDLPSTTSGHVGSSPSSRPASAMDTPMTPLRVRKTRKSLGEDSLPRVPRTPLSYSNKQGVETPNSESSMQSRDSSKADWDEESSSLGLAGPKPKKVEISDESRAWVESVKEKVRMASSDRTIPDIRSDSRFGEMGKVGGTKRLYRKN